MLDRRTLLDGAALLAVYPLFFVVLVLDTPQILLDRVSRYGVARIHRKDIGEFCSRGLDVAWMVSKIQRDKTFLAGRYRTKHFFYALFPFVGIFLWRARTRVVAAFGVALFLSTMAAGDSSASPWLVR